MKVTMKVEVEVEDYEGIDQSDVIQLVSDNFELMKSAEQITDFDIVEVRTRQAPISQQVRGDFFGNILQA